MGKDTNIGAKRARETREELRIDTEGPVKCVLSMVERDLKLPVVIASLPDGVAGCCWREGSRVVLWVNGTHAPVRQRFTLAHELGHVRCGHDAGVPVDTFETISRTTTDSREIQANAFAAELLAPAAGIRALAGEEPSLEEVVLLAARFKISTIACLYRLNSLGLTRRYEVLRQEIADGLHEVVWERLQTSVADDAIGEVDPGSLPRFSPALARSALASIADGSASVEAAAAAASCDAARLASGAAAIGV